jgi:hypothetical protein
MSASIKLGQVSNPVPSNRYVGFYPCLQNAADSTIYNSIVDASGKNNHAVLAGAANAHTNAWGTPNCYTAGAVYGNFAYVLKSAFADWIWSPTKRDSLLWSGRVYLPVAGDGALMAFGTSSTTGGFWIETSATGYAGGPGIRIKFYDTTIGTADPLGYAQLTVAAWHTVTIILDGPGNQGYLFVDGLIAPVNASSNPRALPDIATMTIQGAALNPTFLGLNGGGGANPARGHGFHFAVIPRSAGSIADPYALAMRLHRNPLTPLAENELP